MRSYPSFEAAQFWTGSTFAAAAGAALAMLRVVMTDSLLPLAAGARCWFLPPALPRWASSASSASR